MPIPAVERTRESTDLGSGASHGVALTLLGGVLAVLAWSGIGPHDYETWALEVFPAVIAMVVLGATYHRFRFTPLVYVLIALHCVLLMVGGHYTYAEVPIGTWARDAFHLSRNHYDRLGHFTQGFVPALVAREVLLRNGVVRRGWWLAVIVMCICLGISAMYELLEWGVAEFDGAGSQAFLGTQGDEWDTQKDMAGCFVGAACALLALSRVHDRQMARAASSPAGREASPEL